jgi:hypothetical protein
MTMVLNGFTFKYCVAYSIVYKSRQRYKKTEEDPNTAVLQHTSKKFIKYPKFIKYSWEILYRLKTSTYNNNSEISL